MAKTICFDFDGVIHWYRDGRMDGAIYDEPVPGIKDLIHKLLDEGYFITICSTRATTPEGKKAIEDWLEKYEFPLIPVSGEKPIAAMYIDDRGIRFMGDCNDLYAQIITLSEKGNWIERGFKPFK